MKKVLIVALACVNVLLLLTLVLGLATPRAEAQLPVGGGTDYVVAAGRMGSTDDAIYVIDLRTQRMTAWGMNRTTKRLVPVRGRELARDFREGLQP